MITKPPVLSAGNTLTEQWKHNRRCLQRYGPQAQYLPHPRLLPAGGWSECHRQKAMPVRWDDCGLKSRKMHSPQGQSPPPVEWEHWQNLHCPRLLSDKTVLYTSSRDKVKIRFRYF